MKTDGISENNAFARAPLTDVFHRRSTALTQEAVRFATGWQKEVLRDIVDRNRIRDRLHEQMTGFMGSHVVEKENSIPTIRDSHAAADAPR
jgi:hypothetical protein